VQFLVDENAGVVVARWLRSQGHEVFSVYEEARGIDDDKVIQKAFDENRILITSDKDFGEKVYREHRSHRGIILLRLENERSNNKIDVLQKLLAEYPEQLSDNFIVVTEKLVRFAKQNPENRS
jgi:predicted nuclease of predicted toxin-antitoxin system